MLKFSVIPEGTFLEHMALEVSLILFLNISFKIILLFSFEIQADRQAQRQRDLPSANCLPNAHNRAGIGSGQEPRTLSKHPLGEAGTQVLSPAAFRDIH